LGLAVCTEDDLLGCASDACEADADPISATEFWSTCFDELYEVTCYGTVAEQRDIEGSDQLLEPFFRRIRDADGDDRIASARRRDAVGTTPLESSIECP
jgi:hypothetical protein